METNHLDKQNFFDLSNLNTLRQDALNSGDASTDASKAALKKAAAQFEAIFTQMLLKGMRKANEAFEDEDSPFNSSGVKFFEEMHDQQLSSELSSNGSLGLADLIVQQLSPEAENFMPGSVLRTTNDFMSDKRAGSELPHEKVHIKQKKMTQQSAVRQHKLKPQHSLHSSRRLIMLKSLLVQCGSMLKQRPKKLV